MSDLYKNIAHLSPEKRKLLEQLLAAQNVDLNMSRILPVSRDKNEFPLSYSQQRMWFLDQLEPGNPMYNNPAAVTIDGELNIDAIEKALVAMGQRHEVLRTVFATKDGQPVQIIQPASKLTLEQLDLTHLNAEDQQAQLRREYERSAKTPFNLQTGPLLRTTLLKLAGGHYVFLLTMHHIISDAWTLTIFIREFAELYAGFVAGKPAHLPPLPIQYVDYACRQRDYLTGEVLAKQLHYWRERLAGGDHALDLPTDHPRPKIQSFHGDVLYFNVDANITAALEAMSKRYETTLFMTLLAALDVLLYRYTGQENIAVGTPIANRNRSEVEPLLGVFVNTLVMRADLSGAPTFAELVQQVKESALGAYAHQDIPFETLLEELKPRRDTSRSPYFQTMFVMQNAPAHRLELPGVRLTPVELHTPTAKFDLTFVFEPKNGGLDGQIVYNTDLFDRVTIERMAGHIRRLLAEIGGDPKRRITHLPILTTFEYDDLLSAQKIVERQDDSPAKLLHHNMEERILTAPDSIISCGDMTISYQEFNARANQLAHHLIAAGLTADVIVGIYLERSLDLLISMLAVLKAGGAFLPLDPDYPLERIRYMVADSQAAAVISHSSIAKNLAAENVQLLLLDELAGEIKNQPVENPGVAIAPENIAYVIYTSGSTGQPKGVLIPHAAFAEHCRGIVDFYELTAADNVLQFASTNFDAALEQIFPTLLAGANLVMRDKNVWTTAELINFVREKKLTVINLPPAYWGQCIKTWANEKDSGQTVRLVIIGGDLMSTDTLTYWQQSPLRHARLLNAYGPTETTITATTFQVPTDWQAVLENGAIPIGGKVLERSLYILDRFGQLVPVGVPGELYIGGFALARGYHNRPDLTAERFVPNPFNGSGSRLYRTGDLVRLNNRGAIEFLGRVDQQVKIRGYRIELGEVEAALMLFPGINSVVAIAVPTEAGEKALVAYFVAEKNISPTVTELRDFLAARLPDHAQPAAFMQLEKFPLTPGGKIDRRVLPAPEQLRPRLATEYVAPRSETERRLAEIIAEVLRLERVGVFDNFFDLGGHSMLGMQIISQVRQEFLVELPLRALFENPTAAGIALAIANAQAANVDENELEQLLAELDGLSETEQPRSHAETENA